MEALQSCDIDEPDCDVTAADRFHGLRVAHPLEALKMNQGMTIGSDTSSDVVIDHPSVSLLIFRWWTACLPGVLLLFRH